MTRSVRALQDEPEIGGFEGGRANGDDLLLIAVEQSASTVHLPKQQNRRYPTI